MIKKFLEKYLEKINNSIKEYKNAKKEEEKIYDLRIEMNETFYKNNWKYHPFQLSNLIGTMCYYNVDEEKAILSITDYVKKSDNNGSKKDVCELLDNISENFDYFKEYSLNPRETISKKFPDIYLNPLEENIKNLNDYIEEKNNGRNFDNLNITVYEIKKYETLSYLLEKINKKYKKVSA